MKRFVVCILALLLLLSGCNTKPPVETTLETQVPNTTVVTEPPVVLYQPDSALEQLSQGALRCFAPDQGNITGFVFLEKDIVVFTDSEAGTKLTRFDSASGAVRAERTLNTQVDPYGGSVVTVENRISYYDSEQNACVVLDRSFREVNSVGMPEGCNGVPLLSGDLKTAYCVIGSEIRAVDMATGIPRLIAQTSAQSLQLHQLLISDSVLGCHVTDEHGQSYKEFISCEDGRTLYKDWNLISIISWGENWFARRQDGPYVESLLNCGDGRLYDAVPEAELHTLFPLPDANALCEIARTEDAAVLALYDMAKGNCLARLSLEGSMIFWPKESADGKEIWFVTTDSQTGADILCCWDYEKTGGGDDVQRNTSRFTREKPDTQGLADCKKLADEIAEKYAVEILIHDDMILAEGYQFTEEYQVAAIRRSLEALDLAMSRFPEGFLKTAGSASNNRKITISLIRSFEALDRNAPVDLHGLTYWIDGSVYLALPVSDHMEGDFYHELSHALDTYVYSKSIHYDFWNNCNPEGFAYFENYTDYLNMGDSPWLQPETRAFLDAYSMSFAYEDRATVLEYAMMDGNAEYFASETMQAKLKQLCMGIRQAFGWKKHEGTFVWEQYLQESLAYVNKK